MEVVLLERVEKLGQMGDVVKVRPGYARNFLLPQRKAMRATKENLEFFQHQRVHLEAINLKRREEAEAVAKKMDGLSIVMVRQAAEGGQLYGSVTARDIAESVKDAGFVVQRGQVQLNMPIKSLGRYALQVSLHPEVAVSVTVAVARSQEEAAAGAAAHPDAAALLEQPEEAARAEEAEAEAEAELHGH